MNRWGVLDKNGNLLLISDSNFFFARGSDKTISHLLIRRISPLSFKTIPAIFVSCSTTPSVASIKRRAMSALVSVVATLETENLSAPPSILPLRRIPAVSINRYFFPLCTTVESMGSLVVPGTSLVTIRSSPRRVLISVDLPTFGLPITVILGNFSPASSVYTDPGSKAQTSSIRSSIPYPCSADTGYIGSIPS